MANRFSTQDIGSLKKRGERITMLTAYDYPMARILDCAGIDMILVGDSVANVVLGLDSTTQVGMDVMLHHARAVCRAVARALVVADMPASAVVDKEGAVAAAAQFISLGCGAVKVEWSGHCLDLVRAMRHAGIQVMGHAGLTPQTAKEFKIQGRDALAAKAIVEQSRLFEEAGCFALVIECVPPALAKEISSMLKIPVIGIGAGKYCDGQVLVLHDMLGLNDRKVPRFAKKYADLGAVIMDAVCAYKQEVMAGTFPGPEQTFQ